MDIKIGFSDTAREVVVSSNEEQDTIIEQVAEALSDDNGVLRLTDDKGRVVLARNNRIAYVEVGTTTSRPVGFLH
ncbi:DUF3107 domain-containing protein [Corynebacterium pygosceleis]|uniref:DUF3107 domain-containing protein n=1 Tax=Corynebacterium pygosceleis TaxID=2800406 RepID=A0A9Q4C7W4_9CORY|nr:DUF3107 domain-containing protein [Corynebacterium pygosceleis]MCK7637730.1 DUF3107 domain-containing protein [Corynebacterium pygosceleis]MCK7674921.1 DUF3107 domain-containing protein [Corynebacterium pygosceleis]MCL0119490.1 DUF3107 domain-containing protein [Corynebacterium pygosceleis]MCX7444730.1 DUF3107 domain-containing protein [Corynebacterium pygosceleis]MCX7467941.1 DUF3107 domain-containing protein [Corynebacterium pygosceleis]